MMTPISLVGPGRAGTTVALALAGAGCRIVAVAGHAPFETSTMAAAAACDAQARDVADVGIGARIVIIATPDDAIADVAAELADACETEALLVHLSGARTLSVFDAALAKRPDLRVASMHPLQTIPSTSEGLDRLPGSYAAVSGDPQVLDLVHLLELRPLQVDDPHRTAYHAAAVVASNHIVALLGQVERLARSAGVPFEAFRALVDAAVANAFDLGPAGALTGPVARGDTSTIDAHLQAIDPSERDTYVAMAREAVRLARRRDDAMSRLLGDLLGDAAGDTTPDSDPS